MSPLAGATHFGYIFLTHSHNHISKNQTPFRLGRRPSGCGFFLGGWYPLLGVFLNGNQQGNRFCHFGRSFKEGTPVRFLHVLLLRLPKGPNKGRPPPKARKGLLHEGPQHAAHGPLARREDDTKTRGTQSGFTWGVLGPNEKVKGRKTALRLENTRPVFSGLFKMGWPRIAKKGSNYIGDQILA